MSILNNSIKRGVVKEYHEDDSDNILGNICRTSLDCDAGGEGVEGIAGTGGANMEAEKRIRREIANSNERRRMQSINAGFQSLRTLLPHHEGEKLSKAAILQQTAEYIYNLEQEKTRLLSQNCQLMRQVQQHEGDVPPKKRIKTEMLAAAAAAAAATMPAVSESSDEGLGPMSPEPPVAALVAKTSSEVAELRRQLAGERSIRAHLEDQLRSMESQLYQQIQYQEHDDHDHGELESIVTVIQEPDSIEMQLVQPENVPLVGQTETVVCSPQMSRSPSPLRVATPPPLPPSALSNMVVVEASSSSSVLALALSPPSPPPPPPRLPSVLEAAIKAEPKVEVERLPSPGSSSCCSNSNSSHDDVSCGRLYVANTSRQNLETIVEAIRHLEGDHLFGDEPPCLRPQEVPLALTTAAKAAPPHPPHTERLKTVKVEMNHYLQFHTQQQQQQQSRPGVIVVKQHS